MSSEQHEQGEQRNQSEHQGCVSPVNRRTPAIDQGVHSLSPVHGVHGGESTRARGEARVRTGIDKDSQVERQTAEASWILNLTGCRLMGAEPSLQIGTWSDLDCRELRSAIAIMGLSGLPVIHLESPEVGIEYKVRHVPDRAKGEGFSSYLRRAEQALERRLRKQVA